MASVQMLLLSGADDYGLVQRGSDDVAVCAASGAYNRSETCKLIDDAVVYVKQQGPQAVDALFQKMGNPPAGLPNMPPGRIPDFYRVLATMRFAQNMGGRALTLKELLFVIEAGGGDRDREDDFYRTRTLVKAVLKLPLTPEEQAFMETVRAALEKAQGGGGIALPLALAAGGFAVGGPVGAAAGLVIGIVAGR